MISKTAQLMAALAPPPPLRFNEADAQRAFEAWGCNCGPSAIAAILGLSLEQLRPELGDFEQRGYINVTMMRQILERLAVPFEHWSRRQWVESNPGRRDLASFGLVRVQWTGPWIVGGKPSRWASRYTHWIATCWHDGELKVFDINAMSWHGWLSFWAWDRFIVARILQSIPRAAGWYVANAFEISRGGTNR